MMPLRASGARQDDLQDGDTRMSAGRIIGTVERRGRRTGARMAQEGSKKQSTAQLTNLHDRCHAANSQQAYVPLNNDIKCRVIGV